MNGIALKEARLAAEWTQGDAARKLGVTQAYLSMVETGVRPVSPELSSRVLRTFRFSATALPLEDYRKISRDEHGFKAALGILGYFGFAYLQDAHPVNPAQLLMEALDSEDLESRVVEALPWLPFAYPRLDWEWLVFHAKIRDRQNRLAYVVDLARQLAVRKESAELAQLLSERLLVLERSRLAVEDTLCESSMTGAERKWLAAHRPEFAKHWNLLTDLTLEQVDYSFV